MKAIESDMRDNNAKDLGIRRESSSKCGIYSPL